jgi:hypothetical protein
MCKILSWYSLHLYSSGFLEGRTGVWIQGLTLAKQVLDHLSHTSSPFFALVSFWRWCLMNYLPWLLWTSIFPILVSHVARITGVSHQHSAHYTILYTFLYVWNIFKWPRMVNLEGHVRRKWWTAGWDHPHNPGHYWDLCGRQVLKIS